MWLISMVKTIFQLFGDFYKNNYKFYKNSVEHFREN